MNRKIADLTVKHDEDYDIIEAIEDAGFILVLDWTTSTETHYIVAESEVENADSN